MRFSLALLCLAILAVGWTSSAALAQDDSYEAARRAARRDLQLAKIEFRNYWQIEFPRIRRQLGTEIELTDAEVRAYKERLRLYRPWGRYSTVGPDEYRQRDLRMCILEAELRLRNLIAERNDLHRLRTAEWRILEMRVNDARVRVAEIEAAAENAAAEEELPGG